MSNILPYLETLAPAMVISTTVSVITSSTILITTWFVNKITQKSLLALETKGKTPKGLAFLINKTVKFAIYGIGIMTALDKLGIQITPILASLGVGGLAVSFAMKDSLTNIISGVMLMLYRPFSIDDYIEFKTSSKDFEGKIISIDLRYTTLETDDNKTLVPNSIIVSTPIVIIKK
jgi:small conductance mechanosensitive channel